MSLPYPKPVERDRQRVRIDWTKVSSADVENYSSLVSQSIDELPTVISGCTVTDGMEHQDILDLYAQSLISSLLECALQCFPTHSPSSPTCWLEGCCLWFERVSQLLAQNMERLWLPILRGSISDKKDQT